MRPFPKEVKRINFLALWLELVADMKQARADRPERNVYGQHDSYSDADVAVCVANKTITEAVDHIEKWIEMSGGLRGFGQALN